MCLKISDNDMKQTWERTLSLFRKPNTPAATSAPNMMSRQAKNLRGEKKIKKCQLDFTRFFKHFKPSCLLCTYWAQQALGLLDCSTAAEETYQHHQTSSAYQNVHTWSMDNRQPSITYVNGDSRHNIGSILQKFLFFRFCSVSYYQEKTLSLCLSGFILSCSRAAG